MTDPAFWHNVAHRVGLIWTDMLGDITAQEIGAAFGAGFLASLVALVIFVAGIKVWKGPAPNKAARREQGGRATRFACSAWRRSWCGSQC